MLYSGSEGTRVLRRQAWVPRDGPQSNLGPDVPCLHPVVFGSVVFGSVPSLVLTILFSRRALVFLTPSSAERASAPRTQRSRHDARDAHNCCGAGPRGLRGRASSAARALRRHDSFQTVVRSRLTELWRLESRQPASVPPTVRVLPTMQRRILQLARQRLLVVCALRRLDTRPGAGDRA